MENLSSLVNAVIMVPLLGALFASLSREGARKTAGNALAVGIFTVLSNLVVLWRTALQVDVSKDGWQVVEKFNWLENPKIELVFGIDIFSLMLIAAVHLAVLLGMIGVRHNTYRQKALIVFSLMFLSMISGYFLASDFFSFYIFFEAMLLPLFMLIGIFGDIKNSRCCTGFSFITCWVRYFCLLRWSFYTTIRTSVSVKSAGLFWDADGKCWCGALFLLLFCRGFRFGRFIIGLPR